MSFSELPTRCIFQTHDKSKMLPELDALIKKHAECEAWNDAERTTQILIRVVLFCDFCAARDPMMLPASLLAVALTLPSGAPRLGRRELALGAGAAASFSPLQGLLVHRADAADGALPKVVVAGATGRECATSERMRRVRAELPAHAARASPELCAAHAACAASASLRHALARPLAPSRARPRTHALARTFSCSHHIMPMLASQRRAAECSRGSLLRVACLWWPACATWPRRPSLSRSRRSSCVARWCSRCRRWMRARCNCNASMWCKTTLPRSPRRSPVRSPW